MTRDEFFRQRLQVTKLPPGNAETIPLAKGLGLRARSHGRPPSGLMRMSNKPLLDKEGNPIPMPSRFKKEGF